MATVPVSGILAGMSIAASGGAPGLGGPSAAGSTFTYKFIATGKLFSLEGQTASVLVPNFNSPVDSLGRVSPYVLAGISTGKLGFSGQFNVDPAGAATDGNTMLITNGIYAWFNLILNKLTPWGFPYIYGLISNFRTEGDVENKATMFSCEVTTSGGIPQSGVTPALPAAP